MGVYTVNRTDGSLVRVAGGTLYADAPIGAIQSYGGETAPAGWLICDGSTVSRTDYEDLFNVIGINFGEGDGETTFGIPDLRECVPVGAGKNITKSIVKHDRYNLGQFKDDQLQEHQHQLNIVGSTSHIGQSTSDGTYANYKAGGATVANELRASDIPVGRSGETTHGKQLGVNYIIKAKMVAVPADIQSAIEAQNSYNTEELYTGKRWVDGKLIYRKVFTGLSITTSSSSVWYDTGIDKPTNIETIVASRIMGIDGSPTYSENEISAVGLVAVNKNTGRLDLISVGYQIHVSKIVLEYTKSTD